jgi:phosphopantetheinyl transferase
MSDFLSSKMTMFRGDETFEFSVAFVRNELLNSSILQDLFHPSELNYLEKLTYERRKRSYILGRLSAKLALQKLSDTHLNRTVQIQSGVFGFPIVSCSAIQNTKVSITHSGMLGVSIAYQENHPMGVDLEKIRPDNDRVILSQITDNERSLLQKSQLNDLYGFTSLWCAKEALSKVLKTGMTLNFSFLEIDSVELNDKTIVYEFKNFGQYKALCYTNDMYAMAVVLPRKTTVNLTTFWELFDLSTISFNHNLT